MRLFRRVAAVLRRALGRLVHRLGGATRADIRELRAELAISNQRIIDVEATLGERLSRAHDELQGRVTSLQGVVAIDAVNRFIRHAQPPADSLVSVVLPTYNRPERLRRAIDSVVQQRYERWELLVVDDGGDIDASATVDEIGDERIRCIRQEHGGVCAARNAGLAAARGELIAYLDDDNLMDPDWLYVVAWAFRQYPEIDVIYGAIVIDDLLRLNGEASGFLPLTSFQPWDRETLRMTNLADIGAIAHRSGLPAARFDENLREMGDWDLLVRLTAERDPLALPAVACYYTTDAPDRLSGGPTYGADREKVRSRVSQR